MIRKIALICCLLSLGFGATAASQAGIVATIQESGPNVVISYSGSVLLNGLSYLGVNSGLVNGLATFGVGGDQFSALKGAQDVYSDVQGSASLVVSGSWPGSTAPGTGDSLLILKSATQSLLYLPQGYISGSEIASSFPGFTIPNASFASLGLVGGLSATYSWHTAATTLGPSVTFRTAPEPGSLLLIGLGSVVLLKRRGSIIRN